jgi:hypothetical protein
MYYKSATRLRDRVTSLHFQNLGPNLQFAELMLPVQGSSLRAQPAEESQADVVDMLMAFDIPHKCFGKGAHSLKLVEHHHHTEWPHPKDEVQYTGWEFCQYCAQTCDQVLRDQEYDRLHRRASFRRRRLRQGFATRANVCVDVFSIKNKSHFAYLPDFEGIAEFGDTSSCGIEKVICFWSHTDMLQQIIQ